jgi:hypothetical protein
VLSPSALRRPRCLVTDLHPERGLSRALCEQLGLAMRSMEFTSREEGVFDAIWVCGYEPEEVRRVRGLRHRHPGARLIVTGRRRDREWQSAVRRAGADAVREWPVSQADLRELLLRGGGERVSAAG